MDALKELAIALSEDPALTERTRQAALAVVKSEQEQLDDVAAYSDAIDAERAAFQR